MKKELFRKKSLEKISSPEKIDDYIRSVNIRLWLIAAACLLVLLSVLIWGVFGKVEISQKAVTVCQNREAVCFVAEENIENISAKTEFIINGKIYQAKDISGIPVKVSDALPEYAAHIAKYNENDWAYAAVLYSDLDDGIYETEVITALVSPVSLLMK